MHNHKILFFHNSPDTARFCRRILGEAYELISAGFGDDGVGCAGKNDPDLVLIDLQDDLEAGLELCRHMTADPSTSDIPVMVLFTRDDRQAADLALAAGAADYSSKPLIPTLFAKRVQTTIERFSDRVPRCGRCRRPMHPEWLFCPYDGSALAQVQSR